MTFDARMSPLGGAWLLSLGIFALASIAFTELLGTGTGVSSLSLPVPQSLRVSLGSSMDPTVL